MRWPRDDAKLERVRSLMAEQDLDAIVAPPSDNLLYLTNDWWMKGYDACAVTCEGEPVLAVLEPQLEDAERLSLFGDLRPFAGSHPDDPRPSWFRALAVAREALAERDVTGRVGVDLSQGTQAADRKVSEPTVFSGCHFDAFDGAVGEVVGASPLLAEAPAIKTEQEVERLRLEHAREHVRPGMKESAVGALIEGCVHEVGTGFEGRVELACAFTLVWSGPGIRTFTATGDRPVQEAEPTLVELWVVADGYWCDYTQNLCPGTLRPEYDELLEMLLGVFGGAVDHLRDGAGLPELDRLVRERLAAGGYAGQPSHPIADGVGARAHEPPYAHQAGAGMVRKGMVLAIEPGVYWPGGGGLRLEDNLLVTGDDAERLCRYPAAFGGGNDARGVR